MPLPRILASGSRKPARSFWRLLVLAWVPPLGMGCTASSVAGTYDLPCIQSSAILSEYDFGAMAGTRWRLDVLDRGRRIPLARGRLEIADVACSDGGIVITAKSRSGSFAKRFMDGGHTIPVVVRLSEDGE